MVADLINSLNNEPTGFSARKLSAFVAVIVSVVITERYTSVANLDNVVTIWLGFALLCLGIVTLEQIVKLKNGSRNQDQPQTRDWTQEPGRSQRQNL